MNNETYFVGKDVAEALGYKNTRDALVAHVAEEDKNTVAISDGNRGNPNQTVINESGLYALIFGSKLESAKRFIKLIPRGSCDKMLKTLKTKGDKALARRRKPKTALGMILTMIFAPIFAFINYAVNFKPTPLVGRRRGRKSKKWF